MNEGRQGAKRPTILTGVADTSNALYINRDELIFMENLGYGSQGEVAKIYHPAFGTAAYKQFKSANAPILIQVPQTSSRNIRQRRPGTQIDTNEKRELRYTSQLDNHPNILKFLAYVKVPTLPIERNITGMLLEFMEQAIADPCILNIERVKLWSLQLARALHYCHDIHKVIHRDVKAEKLLFGQLKLLKFSALLCDNYNTLKLCDFGYTRDVNSGNMTTKAKTLCCAAPETIDNNDYGFPCDVYSYAMFIYTILHVAYPFCELVNGQWVSVEYPLKYDRGNIIPSDTNFPVLGTSHFFRTFLLKHNDDEEDIHRPMIQWDKLISRFARQSHSEKQSSIDLEILRWLMKECWRNDQEKRPTMQKIVDLLNFHFENPFAIAYTRENHDNFSIGLKNISHYPVAFKIRNPELVNSFFNYTIMRSSGILKPREQVDLGFQRRVNKEVRLLIEYVKHSKSEGDSSEERESQIPDELRAMQINEVNNVFNDITTNEKTGKKPGSLGLTTLFVPWIPPSTKSQPRIQNRRSSSSL